MDSMPATLVVSGSSIFFWSLPERAVFFILGGPLTGADPGISIFVEKGFADPTPILEATAPPGVGVAAVTLIACDDELPVSVFFFLGEEALPPLVVLTSIATAGCCS